jgi:hypothetical protein
MASYFLCHVSFNLTREYSYIYEGRLVKIMASEGRMGLMVDWLYRVLRPAQEYFTHMETSPLPVKGCKFRPMLGSQGLWAGRDLYRATPAVTRDLGFTGLIQRTAPFSRLLRHTRGCGGSILTRILTGLGLMEMKCIFDIGIIFLYGPRFLRWAMWPMGLCWNCQPMYIA